MQYQNGSNVFATSLAGFRAGFLCGLKFLQTPAWSSGGICVALHCDHQLFGTPDIAASYGESHGRQSENSTIEIVSGVFRCCGAEERDRARLPQRAAGDTRV